MKVWLSRVVLKSIVGFSWMGKRDTQLARETQNIPVDGGDIRAYLYRPEGEGPHPVILYFHGGGFVIGDIDIYDALCRDICKTTGHAVLSVDYRRAPEYPFPTAPNDAFAALGWLVENAVSLGCDINQLVVAGDSAGATLACVTCQRARTAYPGVVKGQILLYPATDHYCRETASYEEYAKGPGLSRDIMVWFWDTYLRNSPVLEPGQVRHEYATPGATGDYEGLPPTLLIIALQDPLRDEGNELGQDLLKAGVPVQHSHYDELHGFVGTHGPKPGHVRALQEMADWLSAQPADALDEVPLQQGMAH